MRIDSRTRLAPAIAAALEPLGVGVAVIDPRALRFTFVSDAFAALLGSSSEELLELASLLDRVHPEDAAAAMACLGQVHDARATLRLLGKDREPVEIDLSARPFDPEDGEGRALAVVARSTRAAAVAAPLEGRDEFFSIASHELRSPLTALHLHAHALARGLKREPPDVGRARRSAAEVERHAERVALMADELLDVVRIRTGRLELACAPCDLAGIVRDVGARFGAEAAVRRATIILDGEHTLPGHWDPVRIEQVVSNLISNALKYGEGTPIAVELHASPARVRLTVRDHGPGIPEEEHARIFEPFVRASPDARVRGAGLGLWIVRRLVEAHGGTVAIASIVGHGTAFIVEVPRDARAHSSRG